MNTFLSCLVLWSDPLSLSLCRPQLVQGSPRSALHHVCVVWSVCSCSSSSSFSPCLLFQNAGAPWCDTGYVTHVCVSLCVPVCVFRSLCVSVQVCECAIISRKWGLGFNSYFLCTHKIRLFLGYHSTSNAHTLTPTYTSILEDYHTTSTVLPLKTQQNLQLTANTFHILLLRERRQ